MYRLMSAETDYRPFVLFCGHFKDLPQWREMELDFEHSILPSFTLRAPLQRGAFHFYLAPGVVPAVIKARADIVLVAGWGEPSCLAAAMTARARGIPYMVASESHSKHSRGALARAARATVFRPMLNGAAAALPTGSLARSYLMELGVPPQKIFIRPNACDVDAIEAATDSVRGSEECTRMRERLSPEGRPLVLFVGRLLHTKGVDLLLDACARLHGEGMELALALAGDGPERPALERRTVELGLTSVHFLGAVPPGRVPLLYAAADCFCLPSREEPWGVVVNEAMSAGLPVVVSDAVGAAPDLVEPGHNGDCFATEDPASLAAALRRTLAGDLKQAGIQARARVGRWDYPRALAGMREAVDYVQRMTTPAAPA